MSKKKQKEMSGPSPIVLWIFVILLVVLLFFLLNSSLFNVSIITVKGAERFSQQDIINVSGITYDTNIFRVDEQKAKENIEQTPYVEVTDIKRTFPAGVEIIVRERTPQAQIATVNGYYIIDEMCIALGLNQAKDESIITVTGLPIAEPVFGKKITSTDESKVNALSRVLEALKKYSLDKDTQSVDITDENSVSIVYCGVKVKLGDAVTSADKLRVLESTFNAVKGKITDGKCLNMETEGAYYVG